MALVVAASPLLLAGCGNFSSNSTITQELVELSELNQGYSEYIEEYPAEDISQILTELVADGFSIVRSESDPSAGDLEETCMAEESAADRSILMRRSEGIFLSTRTYFVVIRVSENCSVTSVKATVTPHHSLFG